MKISLNEIKKYVQIPDNISTKDLITLIGSRLVEVEGTIDLSKKYEKSTIVKVVECEPIPDTHLHLCQISLEPTINNAPINDSAGNRSETAASLVQVVCGAPNVRKGMLAVWLSPGAIVPQTFGEEDFKLSVRKLRGYESHGMLAGLDELDLGDDHSGIVEIDPDMLFPGTTRKVQPGDSFAEAFELNDIILDIENKSLTHRPDTFGLIGFAREVAGILGQKFTEPDLGISKISPKGDISIDITSPEICPRYTCAVIELPDATTTNKYLTPEAVFLAKAGMRTINKIVDATNILMLKTGQPLHAFDYDKFLKVGATTAPKVTVRLAKKDELLQLLDGKTIKCTPDDILITSNNIPVALAGAMGGASTEIDASTKKVFLESATFSLYHLRKTQMHHGIFSEAITRFTKGQPAAQTAPVLSATIAYLRGTPLEYTDAYPSKRPAPIIKITPTEINSLLGTTYSKEIIISTLTNVGFKIEACPDTAVRSETILKVTPPLWRTDIAIKEDIIEEIGRLQGFDNIPQSLPQRPFQSIPKDPLLSLKTTIRSILSDNLGAHELLTYTFVNKKLQKTVGESPSDSYEIVNSISPDLQVLRQTLVPSLLEKVYLNQKSGHKDFTLYEMSQITKKSLGLTSDKVPNVEHHLALVTTADYYTAKALLAELSAKLHLEITIAPLSKDAPFYYEPLHSATISTDSGVILGHLGEIRASIASSLKLTGTISAFELDLSAVLAAPRHLSTTHNFSKYPSVDRDITFKVPADTSYLDLYVTIEKALQSEPDLVYKLTPASIFQKATTSKNISFKLTFASLKKTLESSEISDIMERVTNAVVELHATVV